MQGTAHIFDQDTCLLIQATIIMGLVYKTLWWRCKRIPAICSSLWSDKMYTNGFIGQGRKQSMIIQWHPRCAAGGTVLVFKNVTFK